MDNGEFIMLGKSLFPPKGAIYLEEDIDADINYEQQYIKKII